MSDEGEIVDYVLAVVVDLDKGQGGKRRKGVWYSVVCGWVWVWRSVVWGVQAKGGPDCSREWSLVWFFSFLAPGEFLLG